ncbi:MAG: DNA-binding LytR/AlgR family response regulator [Paraglaciecola sp.]|jgi:DNA-binding LytR/AlgR family response regulator
MKILKCLIVEDEELARDLLENFLEKLPHCEVVGKCENPLKAMKVLKGTSVDLMFLDIQMPELNGIEFLKILQDKPVVIFTTAYPSYALTGYELDVTDYLLKPFSFERFAQAVEKAAALIALKSSQTKLIAPENEKDYILINAEHKVFKIKYIDILYIESMREYAAFYTISKGRILSLISLKKLEMMLPTTSFLRIHKSFIANTDKVSALEGNMVHLEKEKLPIGASYKEEVLARLF